MTETHRMQRWYFKYFLSEIVRTQEDEIPTGQLQSATERGIDYCDCAKLIARDGNGF